MHQEVEKSSNENSHISNVQNLYNYKKTLPNDLNNNSLSSTDSNSVKSNKSFQKNISYNSNSQNCNLFSLNKRNSISISIIT